MYGMKKKLTLRLTPRQRARRQRKISIRRAERTETRRVTGSGEFYSMGFR